MKKAVMELWRRLSFLICVCGAVLLALFASLSPVVLLMPVDFAREQQREGSYMGFRIATEESRRLRSLPIDAYIAEKTRGRLAAVNGQQWEEVRIDLDPAEREKMVALARRTSVPQIFIGDVHVGGYDDMMALHRAGKLEPLLAGQGPEAQA